MRLKKTNNKSLVITIILVVILLLGLGVIYFVYQQDHDKKTHDKVVDNGVSKVDYSKPTNDEIQDGQSTKQESIENDKQSQQDDQQPISVTLNGLQNGDQVIFDSLAQIVSNEGTCTLTVTSGSSKITKTASLFASPSTSSCRGFSVATNELPKGTWKAVLTISADNRTGSATTSLGVN